MGGARARAQARAHTHTHTNTRVGGARAQCAFCRSARAHTYFHTHRWGAHTPQDEDVDEEEDEAFFCVFFPCFANKEDSKAFINPNI